MFCICLRRVNDRWVGANHSTTQYSLTSSELMNLTDGESDRYPYKRRPKAVSQLVRIPSSACYQFMRVPIAETWDHLSWRLLSRGGIASGFDLLCCTTSLDFSLEQCSAVDSKSAVDIFLVADYSHTAASTTALAWSLSTREAHITSILLLARHF